MNNENLYSIPSPQENSFLIGYEKIEREFLNIITTGKINGSWLICGLKGIGKATLAYRIARFMLKKNPSATDTLFVAQDDQVFKLIASNSHPDLKIVERSLTDEERKSKENLIKKGTLLNEDEEKTRKRKNYITVNNIRETEHFLALTPFLGNYKVVIIDAADELNDEAGNALLKILEEPPKNAVMLLISHNIGRLKPTILSRCRKIHMPKLPLEDAEHAVSTLMPAQSPTVIRDALLLANGSIGLALESIIYNGIEVSKQFADLFSSLPDFKPSQINQFAEKIAGHHDCYQMAKILLPNLLARAIKGLSKRIPDAIENIMIDNFAKQHLSLEDLLDLRNEFCHNLELIEQLNLDRKTMIMELFYKSSEIIKSKC